MEHWNQKGLVSEFLCAVVGLLVLGCLVIGCAGSPESDNALGGAPMDPNDTGLTANTPADDPGERDGNPEGPGATYTYVVAALDVGAISDDGLSAPGFNLDQKNGDTCSNKRDYTSFAPDLEPGVDNQLVALSPTMRDWASALGVYFDIAVEVQRTVVVGELLMGIEVSAVHDMENDDAVTVNLRMLQTVDGAAPLSEQIGQDTFTLLPDQTFVTNGSITATGEGTIVDGRLEVVVGDIPLSLNTTLGVIDFTIRDAVMRFDISEDELTAGVIGGGVEINEIHSSVMQGVTSRVHPWVLDTLNVSGLLLGQLRSFADLGDDCGRISAALEGTGVAASFSTPEEL